MPYVSAQYAPPLPPEMLAEPKEAIPAGSSPPTTKASSGTSPRTVRSATGCASTRARAFKFGSMTRLRLTSPSRQRQKQRPKLRYRRKGKDWGLNPRKCRRSSPSLSISAPCSAHAPRNTPRQNYRLMERSSRICATRPPMPRAEPMNNGEDRQGAERFNG